jgi:hypothetical protein
MSIGPVIYSGPAGKMKAVDQPDDAYGRRDKWEFLSALDTIPRLYRRTCSCKGQTHQYGCPDPDAFRPESIADARKATAHLHPVWQDFLSVLEADPDAFITTA